MLKCLNINIKACKGVCKPNSNKKSKTIHKYANHDYYITVRYVYMITYVYPLSLSIITVHVCICVLVCISALRAVVLVTNNVSFPAPWFHPPELETRTLLPSRPLPSPTAVSLTLLAPSHACSETACTPPTGKLAHGVR